MAPQKSISLISWINLLLLATIWGGTFLAVGIAVQDVGVLTLVAFRIVGGSIILWAYVLFKRLPIPTDPRVWGGFLIMGLLNNAIPFSLIAWGQKHTEVGLAAILNASTAIFGVLVAAMVFSDERLTPQKMTGIALGFLGVVTAIGLSALTSFNLSAIAQIAILGASLSYALASAWGRRVLGGLSPQVAAAGMTGFSGATMGILALTIEGTPTLQYSGTIWVALGYLALFATAYAYLLYYRILDAAGAGNLMLVTLLIAPVAMLLGSVVLNETLPLRAILGFGILTLGLLILDGRVLNLLSRKNQP